MFESLKRQEPWYAAGLAFDCTGCGNCVAICPEGAVSLQRVMNLPRLEKGAFVTKARDESARCRHCGRVIGKRSLLDAVEKKLKKSGFDALAERMHYCQACKNRLSEESLGNAGEVI